MLLCVSIPDYPLAIARQDGDDGLMPLIVADRFDRGRVLAVDERALDAGARAGQTVTQAVAAVRARVTVYDALRGTALWEELLDALDAISPLVDDVRPGLAFLDMRGIAGTPEEWVVKTRATIAHFELPSRLGVASNKIAARAAAYVADGTICSEGSERELLAPLPLALLDLDAPAIDRLRLLGVSNLGELAALPHGPFVRRFGSRAAHWHAWARGIDDTPLVPRGHAVAIEASLFGEGRADDEAQVLFAIRVLLAQICNDLERCGKRAGSLCLEVELDNGDVRSFEVQLASPTAQERAMLDVVRAKLEGTTFDDAIVGLKLRAARLEEGGEALGLFGADEFDRQAVAVAIARLEAVLGESVRRAQTREAHVLEERFTYDAFEVPPSSGSAGDKLARGTAVSNERIVPQLRLLAVAEIDVEIRGGEPVTVGSPPQKVVECAGPWRVEIGWFDDAAVARDEYDVLLEDGQLYRIYRQETRWYVRGAYD